MQNRESGEFFHKLVRMGCFCGKEVIKMNGHRYLCNGQIAQGGFSTIELVEDERTGHFYVIKRVSCYSERDEKVVQKEIDIHNMFQHKNILRLVASCFKPNKQATSSSSISECLLLFPFYKKGTLHDELMQRMRKNDPMPGERLLKLFHDICSGLSVMHSHHPNPIAHRDLKPHNILLSEFDEAVIMDLGSADDARIEITGTSQAMTLQDTAAERCCMPYRAPELFNVESFCNIDERTDIWSLGCLLYAMMYYKSPFEAAHERGDSVALAVISGNLTFPDKNTSFDREVKNLVMAMVKVNPMERPFIQFIKDRVEDLIKGGGGGGGGGVRKQSSQEEEEGITISV